MKIVEILGQVPTALSNDESEVFKYIEHRQPVSSESLPDFWKNLAERLCQKGMLHGNEKGSKIIYTVAG